MKNLIKPTVFTNNELGKRLQKLWIEENIDTIASQILKNESHVDFVLVMPRNGGADAACAFESIESYKSMMGLSSNESDHITDYVTSKRSDDNVIFIFLNNQGRISFYTICNELLREINVNLNINQ